MIGFLIGLLLGGMVGITTMALLQAGKTGRYNDEKETEGKDNERDHTDD